MVLHRRRPRFDIYEDCETDRNKSNPNPQTCPGPRQPTVDLAVLNHDQENEYQPSGPGELSTIFNDFSDSEEFERINQLPFTRGNRQVSLNLVSLVNRRLRISQNSPEPEEMVEQAQEVLIPGLPQLPSYVQIPQVEDAPTALDRLRAVQSIAPPFVRTFTPTREIVPSPAASREGSNNDCQPLDVVQSAGSGQSNGSTRSNGNDDGDQGEANRDDDEDESDNDQGGSRKRVRYNSSGERSRPNMRSMYQAMKLGEDEFLELFNAAKEFMLDPDFPDRFECVGGTKEDRIPPDVTKLKLISCGDDFLSKEGWGERTWGADAPGYADSELKWPEHKAKIVVLILPLLRRMVSNERQRRYAAETRANKLAAAQKAKGSRDNSSTVSSPRPPLSSGWRTSQPPTTEPTPQPDVHSHNLSDLFPELESGDTIDLLSDVLTPVQSPFESVAFANLTYIINIIEKNVLIVPKMKINLPEGLSYGRLLHIVHDNSHDNLLLLKVEVLSPYGLVHVTGHESWNSVLQTIKDCIWMDNDVKIICNVQDFSDMDFTAMI